GRVSPEMNQDEATRVIFKSKQHGVIDQSGSRQNNNNQLYRICQRYLADFFVTKYSRQAG
ncbi:MULTISPECIES: hypothetical protein, partial [unclassified Proteiniphilum]